MNIHDVIFQIDIVLIEKKSTLNGNGYFKKILCQLKRNLEINGICLGILIFVLKHF